MSFRFGCRTISVAVYVTHTPVISYTTTHSLCDSSSITLNLTTIDSAGYSYTYSWDNGETTPSIQVTNSGNYNLDITNIGGVNECSTSAIFTVESCYTEPITSNVTIPNVFSPNGDGKNDVFTILNENISDFELFIVNRWGMEIAIVTDNNTGWNGKNSGGKEVPEGVYYYILNYTDHDDQPQTIKNSLTLFR